MGDLISRQAAINWIINLSADIGKIQHQDLWHYEQALDEIRALLEQTAEPSTTLMKVEVGVDKESLRKAMEETELTLLPTEKRGKWVLMSDCTGKYYACSWCGREGYFGMNYCPNCGARMEE